MIQTYNAEDVKLQAAKLNYWRTLAAKDSEKIQNELSAAYMRAIWNPESGQPRPIGGGSPQLPQTLQTLEGAALTANNFTGPQTVIGTGFTGPFSTDYFRKPGAFWMQEAMGVISTTGTPTIAFGTYFGTVIGTITTVLAISPTITTASALANVDWYYQVFGRTVTADSGTTCTMLVAGMLWGNIEVLGTTAATEPSQPVKNATPPSAVTTDLSSAVFLDIKATWGTASASNTITTNFYHLQSRWS